MARGGFISIKIALNRTYKVATSLSKSKKLLTEALVTGNLKARGRRQIEQPRRIRSGPGKVVLRDLASGLTTDDPQKAGWGPIEDIQYGFWDDLTQNWWESWDWDTGRLANLAAGGSVCFYSDVVVSESDLNAILKARSARAKHPDGTSNRPAERRRHSTWDDWVAAAAILACEGKIKPEVARTKLLELINDRLELWNLEPKEESTVGKTARRILDRWGSNPPNGDDFKRQFDLKR